MDDSLLEVVLARLDDPNHRCDAGVEALVLAALDSDTALREAVGEKGPVKMVVPRPDGAGRGEVSVSKMYLERVQVSGFRGIGPSAEIRFQPGPGLTVVCGRNGSGKSSFAEALEVLLTGNIKRWESRSRDWSKTWRCLHGGETVVRADVLVEGVAGVTVIERRWTPEQTAIDEPTTSVQAVGRPRAAIGNYGWAGAAGEFRPFLSHVELEALLDAPVALHKQLNDLLGLDDLDIAAQRLRSERTTLDKVAKAHKEPGRSLVEALRLSDDERAPALLALVESKKPDFDAIEAAAVSTDESDPSGAVLAALAAIAIPSVEEVTEASGALRRAAQAVSDADTDIAAGAETAAALLRAALEHTAAHPGADCPVCGTTGVIDDSWRARTRDSVTAHDLATFELARARRDLTKAKAAAATLLRPAPVVLGDAVGAGIDAEDLRSAWQRWSTSVSDPLELADHLDAAYPDLVAALTGVREQAGDARKARQETWSPLARTTLEWCSKARQAAGAVERIKVVKNAETWLKEGNDALRAERLRPIADQIKRNWTQLRQASNVELVDLRLAGSANQAHVDFDLTVDGTEAGGLSVLSQGETNALALSVFLPRAALPASPFGFIVIDDPVQAMDPSKVDGLALMLASAGETRQVIVFTHDERLPEAVRRLAIPARVMRVSRRASSNVQVDVAKDPTDALLDDARQVVKGETVPATVAEKVVPGICRMALEATLNDIARRRLLAAGAGHGEVEERIAGARRLWERLSLAAKGTVVADADIQSWARNKLDVKSVELLFSLNRAAHGNQVHGLSMADLPADTRTLTRRITEAAT